jgi:hypothetical protein
MPVPPKAHILLAGFVGLLLAVYLITINNFSQTPERSDFAKFYLAGRQFLGGGSIYAILSPGSLTPLAEMAAPHPNLNPPFQTLLLAPLMSWDYSTAFWLWSLISLAAGMGGFSLIYCEILGVKGEPAPLLKSWVLLLMYFPTWVTVASGQFSLLLVLLLAIIFKTARNGKDRVAGLLLGLALSLKLFLGIFLIFFARQRRWRLLGWWAGSFLSCNLLGALICGIDSYLDYLKVLRGVTWYAASWNASFMGFFTRVFGGSENVPLWNLPRLSWVLSLTCLSFLVLGVIRVSRPRGGEKSKDRFDLGFSLSLVAMLLISPLGWMYYFPALAIPLLVSWRFSNRIPDKILISLAWLLSSVPLLLIPATDMNNPVAWLIWGGCYFYALLLLTGILQSLSARLVINP